MQRRAQACPRQRSRWGPLGSVALALAVWLPGADAVAARVGGALGLSSQLVDRGVAVTPATSTVQGAAYWLPAPGWSLSVSASSLLRKPGELRLVTAEASRNWTLSDNWQMQAGLLYYVYPANRVEKLLNRNEASLGWSYRDLLSFSVAAFQLPDSGDRGRWYKAADLSVHQALPAHLALSAGVGISQAPSALYGLGSAEHYRYGHAGLLWNAGSWTAEIDREFSGARGGYAWHAKPPWPWVITVSRSF
ncbi:hypothetical protein NRY95_11320 [Xanthomonas campestris pv. phormiicola]|nr:hypothetical protein [Xanthomonas campestris pv. phormiicola]UYC14349.1 hypothetical protein NRY95_11320 [Xanthomonas campestris pv. phormiicola]